MQEKPLYFIDFFLIEDKKKLIPRQIFVLMKMTTEPLSLKNRVDLIHSKEQLLRRFHESDLGQSNLSDLLAECQEARSITLPKTSDIEPLSFTGLNAFVFFSIMSRLKINEDKLIKYKERLTICDEQIKGFQSIYQLQTTVFGPPAADGEKANFVSQCLGCVADSCSQCPIWKKKSRLHN